MRARVADPQAVDAELDAQGAILWLIRSEAEGACSMLRKDVARRLGNWFDLWSPAIVIGNADSGREKKVVLTARGERFVASMGETKAMSRASWYRTFEKCYPTMKQPLA